MTMKIQRTLLGVFLLWKVLIMIAPFTNGKKPTWLKKMPQRNNISQTKPGIYGWMHDLRQKRKKPITLSRKTASTFGQELRQKDLDPDGILTAFGLGAGAGFLFGPISGVLFGLQALFIGEKKEKGQVAKECCDKETPCSYEERDEYDEDFSWWEVDRLLCERSGYQSGEKCSCTDDSEEKSTFECGLPYWLETQEEETKVPACLNSPCNKPSSDDASKDWSCMSSSTWSAARSTSDLLCIQKSKVCDCRLDCTGKLENGNDVQDDGRDENWKLVDGSYCKLDNEELKLQYGHRGYVTLDGKFICPFMGKSGYPIPTREHNTTGTEIKQLENSWELGNGRYGTAPFLVCQQLKDHKKEKMFSNLTIARPYDLTYEGQQGKVSSDKFLVDSVHCDKDEINSKIHECHHCKQNENYKILECEFPAAVVCIDPMKLVLKEGNVYIGKAPVGATNWKLNAAQVVCNQVYKVSYEIKKYNMHNVPVYQVMKGWEKIEEPEEFIMHNVECDGTEEWLTECAFKTYPVIQDFKGVAGVRCAKCKPGDLKTIIDKIDGPVQTNFCHMDYCTVPTTKNIYYTLKDAHEKLTTRCYPWSCTGLPEIRYPDYCKVLDFLEMAQEISKKLSQKKKYNKLKLTYITKKKNNNDDDEMIELYMELLNQNRKIFSQDIQSEYPVNKEYFKNVVDFETKKARSALKFLHDSWNEQKDSIEKKQKIFSKTLRTLFESTFTIHPTPFPFPNNLHSKSALLEAYNGAEEWEWKGSYEGVKKWLYVHFLLKINKTYSDWSANEKEISNMLYSLEDELDNMHSIANKPMKHRQKTEKLQKAYHDLENFINSFNLADYVHLVELMIEQTCSYVNSPNGVVVCNDARIQLEILVSFMENFQNHKLKTIDAILDLVRDILFIHETYYLINYSPDSVNGIDIAIAKKTALVLHLVHKMTLYQEICFYIKYLNNGIEKEICNDGSVSNPSLYDNLDETTCGKEPLFLNIPAMIRRGSEALPPGTLDLKILFDKPQKGSMLFQIPDVKWLVDNGWIKNKSDHEHEQEYGGPFYVKQLQLLSLPAQVTHNKPIETSFTLMKNILGNQEYIYDTPVKSTYKYNENREMDNIKKPEKNPYNQRNCKKNAAIYGNSATFPYPYPSLFSLWKVDVQIPEIAKKAQPFPMGKFYLKIKANICFRNYQKYVVNKVSQTTNDQCCQNFENNTADIVDCQRCLEGSTPRLNGYFCETCAAGYEPNYKDTNWYGCQKCRENRYKIHAGNNACIDCNDGKYTNGKHGSTFCISRNHSLNL